MKLIVWLGNPWSAYVHTRHNVGFFILDHFIELHHLGPWRHKRWGDLIETVWQDQKICFLKPMEYMNRSWSAVVTIARFFDIVPRDILVIHDDIDLRLGKIQLKFWGSSAGHNGIKDIIAKLWTKDFRRLRIGVDRPLNQQDVATYVLSPFTREEHTLLEEYMPHIERLIIQYMWW